MIYDLVLITPNTSCIVTSLGRLTTPLLFLKGYLISKDSGLKIKIINLPEYNNDYTVIPPSKYYGITVATVNVPEVTKLSNYLRTTFPTSIIVGGGPHPSSLPYHSLQTGLFDVVIRGVGEEALYKLITQDFTKSGFIVDKRYSCYHPSLDDSKKEAYNLHRRDIYKNVLWDLSDIALNKYRALPFFTSLGCVQRCNFCSKTSDHYSRLPEAFIIDCIEKLTPFINDQCYLWLEDEDVFYDFGYKTSIFKYLAKRKLPFICHGRLDGMTPGKVSILEEAGCKEIRLGLESGSSQVLHNMNKHLQLPDPILLSKFPKLFPNIDFGFYVMAGYPGETLEDVFMTLDYIQKAQFTWCRLSTHIPYPGTTDWYSMPKEIRNILASSFDNFYDAGKEGKSGFDHLHAQIINSSLGSDTLFTKKFKQLSEGLENIE